MKYSSSPSLYQEGSVEKPITKASQNPAGPADNFTNPCQDSCGKEPPHSKVDSLYEVKNYIGSVKEGRAMTGGGWRVAHAGD